MRYRRRIAEIAPDVFPLAALLRHHDQHLAVWFAQQLAVEQVRGYGVVERNPLVRHFHAGERDIQTVAFSPQRGQHCRLIDKRLLMVEQHMAIADRDDVVMKHAAIDSLRPAGQTPCSADPADAGGPPLRWPRGLPRRILHRGDTAAGASTIDEKLHPCRSYSRQKRLWLAAPSSPRSPCCGSAAWWAK